MMLKLLMKTKSYLEHLCKEVSDSKKEDSAMWKEVIDRFHKNYWWIREASNLINYLYHLPWKLRWSFVARLTDSKMGILVKKIVIKNLYLVLLEHYYYVDFPWCFDRKICREFSSSTILLRINWKNSWNQSVKKVTQMMCQNLFLAHTFLEQAVLKNISKIFKSI